MVPRGFGSFWDFPLVTVPRKGMKADTDSKVSDRRWVAEQPVVRTMGGKGARATRLGPNLPLEGKHGKTPAHQYSI